MSEATDQATTKQNSWKLPPWLITILISAVVSLSTFLGTIGYQHLAVQPKLQGRIIFAAFGDTGETRLFSNTRKSTVTLWVYLATPRDIPISIMDYELYMEVDGVWTQYSTVYESINSFTLGFQERDANFGDYTITFPNDSSMLTSQISKPITRENPRGGALLFLAPELYSEQALSRIRLRVLDGYGNDYIFERETGLTQNPWVISRLAPGVIIEKVKGGNSTN